LQELWPKFGIKATSSKMLSAEFTSGWTKSGLGQESQANLWILEGFPGVERPKQCIFD